MLRFPIVLPAAVVIACVFDGSLANAGERGNRGDRPNIVFLLADDLGWADLGCYGSDLHETPHLDRLATQGIRFTDAYASASSCSPTRAALLTGKNPARLGITDWIAWKADYVRPHAKLKEVSNAEQLELEEETLAELVADAGYRTAHLGKWHLGHDRYFPQHQGFDLNVGGIETGFPPGGFFLPNRIDLPNVTRGEYLTNYLTDRAVEFMQDSKDRPFLLSLWYYVVHKPIEGPDDLVKYYERKISRTNPRRHRNAEYAAMVGALDRSVGRLLNTLDDLGIADETLVVFTSDNGGIGKNYGRWDDVTNNWPLRRGKGSYYEGGLRVPLIVRQPGVTPSNTECSVPVVTHDWFPTISTMLGEDTADDIDGVDLSELLRRPDETKLNRQAIYWHYPHFHPGGGPGTAMRSGDWKLIENFEDGSLELYNLKQDIEEEWNLAPERPLIADRLHRQMKNWRETIGAKLPKANPDYDPERAHQHVWLSGDGK
ncbi:sulfatase [Stratiformator vulcanicus]|uniref:Arylsulfatase n=1 Tax=Stratiformator vulcanicus TaxID=2527980 RepID=A0A517QYM6_9PLAN|nr:sulfatase [Stratiformator vulcanicus]QDT36742.1 Arylsulfatase [Stratiformator vulcanicus]